MAVVDHGAGFDETAIGESLRIMQRQRTVDVFAALDGLCEIAACECANVPPQGCNALNGGVPAPG